MKQIALGVSFVLAAAGAARAQEPVRVFVEGGAFAGVELRSHSMVEPPDVTGLQGDLSGTVPGADFAIGGFLAPRVSVRFEMAFPGGLDASTTETETIGTIRYSLTQAQEYRAWSGSMLLGYHTARHGGVQVAYVGGVAFMRERRRASASESLTGLPPGLYDPQSIAETAVNYRAAAEAGLDVDVRFTRTLSVVPELRVVAFNGALSVRPTIALRWTR